MSNRPPARPGPSIPVLLLLGAVLVAVVALIAVLLLRDAGDGAGLADEDGGEVEREVVTIGEGETVRPAPDPPETPVQNPDHVREVLKEGRTYRGTLTFGMEAKTVEKDWAVSEVLNTAYGGQATISRKIEENTGSRVIEIRTFDRIAVTLLATTVEDVSFDLGGFGTAAALVMQYVEPGSPVVFATVAPMAEALLESGSQAYVNERNAVTRGQLDELTGKSVRITYIDGEGVTALEPVGCTLTKDEAAFLGATAVLSDCYLLPKGMKPGDTWDVSGRQMAGMLMDPTWRGVPSGTLEARRNADESTPFGPRAVVEITDGTIEIDTSDNADLSLGTMTPRGTMKVSRNEGHVTRGDLTASATINIKSKDHILFESSFKTDPRFMIEYECELLPEGAAD